MVNLKVFKIRHALTHNYYLLLINKSLLQIKIGIILNHMHFYLYVMKCKYFITLFKFKYFIFKMYFFFYIYYIKLTFLMHYIKYFNLITGKSAECFELEILCISGSAGIVHTLCIISKVRILFNKITILMEKF
jgi:hypothetical protein